MIRSILVGVSVLCLALGSAAMAAEKTQHTTEPRQAEGLPGVEPIADEVEEVAGQGSSEQDGMEKTQDEMIEQENTDGCDGVIAEANMPCSMDGEPPLP